MRVSMIAVLTLMALGIGCSAQAQDCDTHQTAMNACASQQLAQLDADLNRHYQAQMSYLQDPARKQALQQAQQKWIAYRDADCLYQVGKAQDSGSIWPLLQAQCMAAHTKVRVEQLKAYTACRQEGCPR